jgi:hypothetical protein
LGQGFFPVQDKIGIARDFGYPVHHAFFSVIPAFDILKNSQFSLFPGLKIFMVNQLCFQRFKKASALPAKKALNVKGYCCFL